MATNQIHKDGDRLAWPVPEGTTSGDFVTVGDGLHGVAITDRDPVGMATVWLGGVWALPVSTTTAAEVGAKVYLTAAGNLTPQPGTDPGNVHVGHFVSEKSTTAGEACRVRLLKA